MILICVKPTLKFDILFLLVQFLGVVIGSIRLGNRNNLDIRISFKKCFTLKWAIFLLVHLHDIIDSKYYLGFDENVEGNI